ncbi:colicin D domain-containing protein [Auraticoccus monumenti]|uniref:colicin D domain-containing protein n=1 Tax=Auraticoccus monumenti TaxID=675864 RepID=UPI0018D40434|nr:colicin D domain-containing protein [Auraticoccus monumenti]
MQKKFKHAGDFGIPGNYNKAKGEQYDRVLHDHVNAPTTTPIDGTYHREPVIHHLDTSTGLNVVTKPDGRFVTAWKFNSDQLRNVTTHGGL